MKRKLSIFIIFVIAAWVFLHINNKWLQTSEYTILSDRIPTSFNGVTIVQISDLHDATFGEKQKTLVEKVKKIKPDFVFLTGDLIDSNRYDLQNTLDLVEQLTAMTEVFYVTGNHEVAINKVAEITEAFISLGVHVLENEAAILERDNEVLVIAGVEDPLMNGIYPADEVISDSIDLALTEVPKDAYKILLSHRPEVFDTYIGKQVDLIFTGHAHGGQVRIPGLGGLIAPGQGWFPAYTSGKHEKSTTTMVVSRGLGNSIIPFRIFNRPEVVVVTLESDR